MKKQRLSHLDAAQGGKEERERRTYGTVIERQTPADTAMRQKQASEIRLVLSTEACIG